MTLALAGLPGQFDESKHPRQRGGKFASKGGAEEPAGDSGGAAPSGVSRPHLEAAVELATRAQDPANPLAGEMLDKARQLREAATGGAGELSPEEDYAKNGTRAKAFKAWFGDWEADPEHASKIVTEDGEPSVNIAWDQKGKPVEFYHATNKDFTAFREGWAFFSPSEDYASNYGNKSLLKCYLNVRNPIDLRSLPGMDDVKAGDVRDALLEHGIDIPVKKLGVGEIHEVLKPAREEIRRQAIAKGYDGLIQNENYAGKESETIAVFQPHQIKSVKNRGTFDPTQHDIYLSAATQKALLSLNCGTGAGGFAPGNTCAKGSADLIGVAGVNLERELRPPTGTGLDALPSLRRTARLLADARYHGVMQGRTPDRQAFAGQAESAFGESMKAVAEGLPEPGVAPGDAKALRGALVIDPAELGGERDGALALAAKASPVAGPGFDGLHVVVPEGPARKAFAAIASAGDQAAFGERIKDTSDPEGLLGKLWDASRAPVETVGGRQVKRIALRAALVKKSDGAVRLVSSEKLDGPAKPATAH